MTIGSIFWNIADNLIQNKIILKCAMSSKCYNTFGSNSKSRLATITVFSPTFMYGDINLWSSLFEIILQLDKCKLLPTILVKPEDFLELSGKVLLECETVPLGSQKSESGLFSSLYSYASGGETINKIQTSN